MRRPTHTAALAALALLTLTACGEEKPVKGTIHEKEYKQAIYEDKIVPVYTEVRACNARRGCTTSRSQTSTRTERHLKKAECFEIELTNGEETCITSRDVWEKLQPGDPYDSSKY